MNYGPKWADIELKIGNSSALDLFSKGKITEIEILEDYKNSYIRVYKDDKVIKSYGPVEETDVRLSIVFSYFMILLTQSKRLSYRGDKKKKTAYISIEVPHKQELLKLRCFSKTTNSHKGKMSLTLVSKTSQN